MLCYVMLCLYNNSGIDAATGGFDEEEGYYYTGIWDNGTPVRQHYLWIVDVRTNIGKYTITRLPLHNDTTGTVHGPQPGKYSTATHTWLGDMNQYNLISVDAHDPTWTDLVDIWAPELVPVFPIPKHPRHGMDWTTTPESPIGGKLGTFVAGVNEWDQVQQRYIAKIVL
jgi:hypothetical protein